MNRLAPRERTVDPSAKSPDRIAARGFQDRIEASRYGRAAISAFVAATVLSLVVWNLPESELRSRAFPVVETYIGLTGLGQNWGVFAPDPRRETISLAARARYADGREEILEFPSGDPVIGAYWDYRWLKWGEWASSTAHQELWQPTAAWFARKAAEGGEEPTTVTLVRRSYPLFPPGPGPERGAQREDEYYALTVEPPTDAP